MQRTVSLFFLMIGLVIGWIPWYFEGTLNPATFGETWGGLNPLANLSYFSFPLVIKGFGDSITI